MARSHKSIFYLCRVSLVGCSMLLTCHLSEAQIIQNNAKEEVQTQAGKSSPPLDSGVQVFLPPVLEKGKPAWGSIYDTDGSLLAEQKLLVNNQQCQSNEFGSFNFTCPAANSFSVAVLDPQGSKLWETRYASTARGLMVSDKSAAELIDNLDELAAHSGSEPVISHAPSIVEPLQTFVVVGKNFSGKQGDNDVEIDDRSSDILASSPRSLVAVSERFLKLGPIKELIVSTRDMSSLPSELDVSRVDLKFEPGSTGNSKLRVNIVGSNLPSAVSVVNQNPKANMRFGGWRLGRQNIFLSPGGQRNSFEIDADTALSATSPSAHIISNGIFDPYSMRSTRSLLTRAVADAGERAEAIRLRKREITLEAQQAQVNQERLDLLKSGKLSADEENKFDTSGKAIASRLFRVEKMLQARRALIESDGSGDYPKLLDAAANNTLASLEAVLSCKDLGFTEARLVKVSGRRAAEEQSQGSSPPYLPAYQNPPTAFLESYRKKYGRKGIIPPPPLTATLLPPPPPYRPGPNDLGPFLTEPPPPKATRNEALKNPKARKGKKGSLKSDTAVKSGHLHKQSRKTHSTPRVGIIPAPVFLWPEC